MSRNLYLLSTGTMIVIALFTITTLRKRYIKQKCEHFTIQPLEQTDVLLDSTSSPTVKHTSYRKSSNQRPTSPMSSFEQTTNNQMHTSPNNGSITLPELAFY
jgi:hypothetical protein